jgi:hypothetical protein
MCEGISVSWRDLPASLIEKYGLQERVITRQDGAECEVRFLFRDPRPLIPAWADNQLGIYLWGNRDRRSKLPITGWARLEDVEAGQWSWLRPEPVDIPACFGFDKGIWFQVREGIRGILVCDEAGKPHVYVLTEPASHYYQVMTRQERMPVLIGERI